MATPIGTDKLKILTFGAGAIGTYVGGSLALIGQEVVFVERPEVAANLRKRGLRLDLSVDKRRQSKDVSIIEPSSFVCVSSLAEALNYGPFDVAVFALKSFDTAAALEEMKPLSGKMPPLLCLQNGVDNEPQIAGVLGTEKVIPGTSSSAVGRRDAGDIVLERLRGIGVADGHPLSRVLVRIMDEAGLNAKLYPDAQDMKWSKMLTNLIANATAAILNMTAREVLQHPGLYKLEMRQLSEAKTVMKARGIKVVDLPGTPVRLLAAASDWPGFVRPLAARVIGGGRGGKMPSFHIDLHAGRGRSEVGWINGAVVRAGEELKIPTPVNRLLNDTLNAMAEGKLDKEAFMHRPQELLKKLSDYE